MILDYKIVIGVTKCKTESYSGIGNVTSIMNFPDDNKNDPS